MNKQITLHYDEEGDFFEMNVGKKTKGNFKNLGKGVFERIDAKTGKVTGIAIFGFRKRTKGVRDLKVSLPFIHS